MKLTSDDMQRVFDIIEKYKSQLDLNLRIPLVEYEERYKKVWERLEARGIDLGFFFWYREMPGDGLYLTGYNPNIERASGVIAPGKRPMLLCGPESGILSTEVGLGLETNFVEEFSIPDEYYEGLTRANLTDVIREYAGRQIRTIGCMTELDLVPKKFYDVLVNDIAENVTVVDASEILADLRYEKSEAEFQCMKQASTIASAAVRAMLAVAKPDIRETELAAVGDFTIKALGGTGYGVETMIMSGDRNRTVIGPATNRVIAEGELVQIGVSPSYEGYKGVCRRAFVMGKRTPLQKAYFDIMNTGYEIAKKELEEVVKNDYPINRIDLAPRNYFNTQELEGVNMKSCHFYSTCHGTGLTECLEKLVVHPEIPEHYGENVGIMLDLGVYGHPNVEICGGCVESAFFKKGNQLICFTDVPADVQDLLNF